MKHQIRTDAAVAMFDAARKLDTGQEIALALSQRSSGRFGGSIIANRVVSTNGVELQRVAT
jgi:hypothetical protein